MANGTPVAHPGWQDIQGMFAPFASQMMWRFNLNSYDDVAANAEIILLRISSPGMIMPPPPFPPLSTAQIQTFRNWVNDKCPQTPSTGPVSAAAPTLQATAPAPAATVMSSQPDSPFRFE